MLGKFIHLSASKTISHDSNHASVEPPHAPLETRPENLATPHEEGNKLTVGPNIKLNGVEIQDCEILVVEGKVEASMHSRDIRIAEGGVFSGKAEIDVAEIRGQFDGELIAHKRLVVYATGKVTGKIHYGALTIEEGGILSGEVGEIPREPKSPRPHPALPPAGIEIAPHPYRTSVLGRSKLGSQRS